MVREITPLRINTIYSAAESSEKPLGFTIPPILTGNIHKQREIANYFGLTVEELPFVSFNIKEIQEPDQKEVAQDKAYRAWEANGFTPTLVEDTSLQIYDLEDDFEAPNVKSWAATRAKRNKRCDELTRINSERKALAITTLAIYDGQEFITWHGYTEGKIAQNPQGPDLFGWDDIFIPDEGDGRTYAQMTLEEKNETSMRRRAFDDFLKRPPNLDKRVFQLPEPYFMQTDSVDESLFGVEQTRRHVFDLDVTRDALIDKSGRVNLETLPKFLETSISDPKYGFFRYVIGGENSPDNGIILTPMDRAIDVEGDEYRLALDKRGKPIFWQMGSEAMRMAFAARALEFENHHNKERYEYLRSMIRGDITIPKRSNIRSYVIEELIEMKKKEDPKQAEKEDEQCWKEAYEVVESFIQEEYEIHGTAAARELGYAREFSPDKKMSRTIATNDGLFTDASGIPTSIFGLGGMPPVTGSADVLSTAALSYMDSYISHNGIFAGNFERQLGLFRKAKEKVKKLGLPSDIEELCIAHIGLSVGSENPEEVERNVKAFLAEGGSLVRVYTTNTDYRVVDTARLVRKQMDEFEKRGNLGEIGGKKLRICVGPIVDIEQAKELVSPDIRVNILLVGHGGGENCTSLAGGGAANALELAYLMSLMPEFNNTAIGLEGGTGDTIGALLGFIDVISLNRRGVAAGIETGGLYVQLANGRIGQPYHGTASAITQWIEALSNPAIAEKRLDRAGRLKNVEGKPNYMVKPRVMNSIVDAWLAARMLAGRALADQKSGSLADLRDRIAKEGYTNHRIITPEAFLTANHHRGKS